MSIISFNKVAQNRLFGRFSTCHWVRACATHGAVSLSRRGSRGGKVPRLSNQVCAAVMRVDVTRTHDHCLYLGAAIDLGGACRCHVRPTPLPAVHKCVTDILCSCVRIYASIRVTLLLVAVLLHWISSTCPHMALLIARPPRLCSSPRARACWIA